MRDFALIWDALVARVARPYSRLYITGDISGWVLHEEAKALAGITQQLGIPSRLLPHGSSRGITKQVIFHCSQWILRSLHNDISSKGILRGGNRLAFSYFHGKPSAENPEFRECFEAFKKFHCYFSRVQVSHNAMRELLLTTGIEPEKIALIPIGINPDYFQLQTREKKKAARARLGIPQSATVIGSFQKDGVGWDEGLEPKLIKGPDIFLEVLRGLKCKHPELYVLLSGPSRGFVKRGLEELGIPFTHTFFARYEDSVKLYEAIDLMLVTSREEGGPKAILESMAAGVPLVTTQVGQAADLVKTGINGWMLPVDDVEGLIFHASQVLESSAATLQPILSDAARTAADHSYVRQIPLWQKFFQGVIE